MRSWSNRAICGLAGLSLVLGGCSSAAAVTVADAWSRPVPPVSPSSAIYLEISNGLDTPITLVDAISAACGAVQIHETTMDDAGVMRMQHLTAGLSLDPGEKAELQPGGIHLMCLEPAVFDGSFELELQFTGADPVVASVVIEER